MDYREEKIRQFDQALLTLEEMMAEKEKSVIVRDAAIQRFEYTVETYWKALKVYLFETQGVDASTPKAVVRAAGSADMLAPEDVALALRMIDDRNKTSHLYKRSLADELFAKLLTYTQHMRDACEKLKQEK